MSDGKSKPRTVAAWLPFDRSIPRPLLEEMLPELVKAFAAQSGKSPRFIRERVKATRLRNDQYGSVTTGESE